MSLAPTLLSDTACMHAIHPGCREETQAPLEDHTDSTDKKPTPTIKASGLLLYGNTNTPPLICTPEWKCSFSS